MVFNNKFVSKFLTVDESISHWSFWECCSAAWHFSEKQIIDDVTLGDFPAETSHQTSRF